MSDSDDDMPPPLEDMSAQLAVQKEMKAKAEGSFLQKDEMVEEVRLAPKKEKNISKIAPRDDIDFDAKPKT